MPLTTKLNGDNRPHAAIFTKRRTNKLHRCNNAVPIRYASFDAVSSFVMIEGCGIACSIGGPRGVSV